MPAGTIRLHRVLRAKHERVYKAFLDADAKAKWLRLPVEMCYLGWQGSLAQLATLVEPEIPG